LGLTTLEKRLARGDLLETFKFVTGRDKVKVEDCFECKKITTISRSPVQDDSPEEPYEYPIKFLQSTCCEFVNIWNDLPITVVSASSVNNLKNRMDDCAEWGRSWYSYWPVILWLFAFC